MHTPILRLFETHLTVRDLDRSIAFYRDVLGWKLAREFAARRVAFFWLGAEGASMLGLWETGTAPMSMRLHTAFAVEKDALLAAPEVLSRCGIQPLDFHGKPATEPVVLAWLPALSLYFQDPDGHMLEYLAMLTDAPEPNGGVVPYSEWRRRHGE